MSSSARLTPRQADAQDRRRRMTQQRQVLSNRIRKQKKSEYLARKRNLLPSASRGNEDILGNTESVVDQFRPLVDKFCSNQCTGSLRALHDALERKSLTATEENWLVILNEDDIATATAFLNHLQAPANSSETLALALGILARLTAISYSSPVGISSYYGSPPVSWSSLILQADPWLTYLIGLARQSSPACVILGNLVGEANGQSFYKLRTMGLISALLEAVHDPSGAWALTNAIRHDTTEWASTYCNPQALSAPLLEQLLLEGPVATQTAWMLASLTRREERVVQYLMGHSSFPITVVECLSRPVSNDQLIPIIQTLGNIASSFSESGSAFSGNLIHANSSLCPAIGNLISKHQNREIVHQSAWLAGCLLYDAGIPNHPATEVARTLLPALFHELRVDTNQSVDSQREIAHALWNALSSPEEVPSETPRLLSLVPWEVVYSSLCALVRLSGSLDTDAVIAAVSVLEVLIKSDGPENRLKSALEEQDVVDALEKVCDSQNVEASEIAANLLDDCFYDEEQDDYSDTRSSQEQFAFTPPSSGMGRGMGRGRGATMPAWMTREH